MTDERARVVAALAGAGGVVPVVRTVVLDGDTPVGTFTKVRRPPFAFLLESLIGGERWARYTFLGTEPREVWRYHAGVVERWTAAAGWQAAGEAPDPLAHLAAQLRPAQPRTTADLPPFFGGAVGFWSYDLVRTLERLPPGPADDLAIPDAMLMLVDALVILDNVFGHGILVANVDAAPGTPERELHRRYDVALERLETLHARLAAPHHLRPLEPRSAIPPSATSAYSRQAFERDVRRIKRYIEAGDCLQVVLSRRQEVPGAVDPLLLYRHLRALNPAPYLFLLEFADLAVVGSSPEVLVRVQQRDVTVRPIAGTRPRGATPAEDQRLADELRADPKERAEHLMLVDLGRNDVGRVAEFGSVSVTEHLVLERYSHVQHLVSEVRGHLRPGLDALDALRAAFPAGTVSGAPKIRAMEIIAELEPVRRGVYAGAVGYVGWGARTLDSAIAIRSALVLPGQTLVQAGAGVVADSVPEREFEETEAKAQAVLRALGNALEER